MKLLVALLERPGTLILREELHSLLWPDGTFVDFDHGLNAAATRLRQTLGDAAETPRFIESVPRRGYRFIAPVERVECGAKTFTTQPSQQTVIPPAVDRTSAGEAGMQATSTLSSTPTNRSRFVRLAWGGAIALLLCVGIVMFLRFRERPSVERQVSFTLLPPNATRFADFDTIAVSPDGQMLAFTATSSSGEQQLWVRALDSSQSRRLSDTAGASFPFWSSDSKSIGFS